MSREMIEFALQTESQRRHHGMLCRSEEPILSVLQKSWQGLLEQANAIAPFRPLIRISAVTLCVELDELLMEWRNLWTAEWFVQEEQFKDVLAHVAKRAMEVRVQAEILAGTVHGSSQVASQSQSLEVFIGEIEGETNRLQDLLARAEDPVLLAGLVEMRCSNDRIEIDRIRAWKRQRQLY